MSATAKNLHIFNDANGFFANKTTRFINSIQPDKNVFINTALHCSHKIDDISYTSVTDFLRTASAGGCKLVVFHSYSYSNRGDLKLVKAAFQRNSVKLVWVFWSHEYYQLPEFFSKLYRGFSRKYYLRKRIHFHAEYLLNYFKRKNPAPFYSGLRSFENTFTQFDVMSSLIKGDYDLVMKKFPEVTYQFASYIWLSDFPKLALDVHKEKKDIMVGHSGSPILNHYEIIEQLSGSKSDNTIYVPLAYGKRSYITHLQKEIASGFPDLKIEFQTQLMDKDAYYRRVNEVGFFILNAYCQQALGNIFFFLWTGTKVFLRKETSTYQTLHEKGFHIYAIEDGFSPAALVPLTASEQVKNRELVEHMINDDRVSAAWMELLKMNE